MPRASSLSAYASVHLCWEMRGCSMTGRRPPTGSRATCSPGASRAAGFARRAVRGGWERHHLGRHRGRDRLLPAPRPAASWCRRCRPYGPTAGDAAASTGWTGPIYRAACAATAEREPIAWRLEWAREHLAEPLSLDMLAEVARMGRRTFTRRFREATGTTVNKWVNAERVARAQQLLETSAMPIDVIASKAGFGTTLSLRQQFSAQLGTSPSGYRRTSCSTQDGDA
jgi:AraC-like DNA-binding protein